MRQTGGFQIAPEIRIFQTSVTEVQCLLSSKNISFALFYIADTLALLKLLSINTWLSKAIFQKRKRLKISTLKPACSERADCSASGFAACSFLKTKGSKDTLLVILRMCNVWFHRCRQYRRLNGQLSNSFYLLIILIVFSIKIFSFLVFVVV